ncbi:MAG: hypothetical protein EAZ55_00970 [Cytophagales bacterium]|nr:MAG: hypothetical protein EAZ55_00970 [Cytophagales bacterium]
MKHLLYSLFLLIICWNIASAQTLQQDIDKAFEYYEKSNYKKALLLFEKHFESIVESIREDKDGLLNFLNIMVKCCEETNQPEKAKELRTYIEGLEAQLQPKNNQISTEVLADIVRSIPSPLEISFLIKDLGIQYNKGLLNSTEDKTTNYTTDFKKALNLGVYSADLGYSNIYSQTQDALYFLNSIKKMADGLQIGDFFDFNALKSAINSNNLDSLLIVTNLNLKRINENLQKRERANLTVLIVTGGWLEMLYITCEVAKKTPNELLNNRIGEQKLILDQLMLLLSIYEEENTKIKELRNELGELQKIYNNVKIEFSQSKDPTVTKEQNGILIVEDNTSNKINLTDKDLDNILKTTIKIRNKIISDEN